MVSTATNETVASALRRQIGELHTERDTLAAEAQTILTRNEAAGALTGDDEARFKGIEAELDRIKKREEGYASILDKATAGHLGFERGSGVAQVQTRDVTPVDEARRLIDATHQRGALPDHAAQRATTLLDGSEHDLAVRWVLAAGSEAYARAFARVAADPQRGHLEWDGEESEAFRKVALLQRAMGIGAGATGGFMVPLTLDPSILLTSDGSSDPLRRISRVVTTVTDAWAGVTSAGSTAEWKAEAATVADASPTIAQPSVPVNFGSAFVPYSFEVGMDAAGFLPELQRVLIDAADQLQAQAYMRGTGSGQPTGVVTGLPAGSKVAAGTADTLTADDVVGLQNALPPRFQPRAQWCANLTVINSIGSFETTNGALRFPEVANGRLLNRQLNEGSHLDSPADTASAGNDSVLLYGDFQQFLIVDRIGTQLEFIQNMLDPTTGRPTGQRGALLWFRTGSDVLVDNAFRLLTT